MKIFNERVLTPYRIINNGTVVITGNKITSVEEGNIDVPEAVEIDAKGLYISTGTGSTLPQGSRARKVYGHIVPFIQY